MTDFPRSPLEFQRRFPDDAACAAYLAAVVGGLRLPRMRLSAGLLAGDEEAYLSVLGPAIGRPR